MTTPFHVPPGCSIAHDANLCRYTLTMPNGKTLNSSDKFMAIPAAQNYINAQVSINGGDQHGIDRQPGATLYGGARPATGAAAVPGTAIQASPGTVIPVPKGIDPQDYARQITGKIARLTIIDDPEEDDPMCIFDDLLGGALSQALGGVGQGGMRGAATGPQSPQYLQNQKLMQAAQAAQQQDVNQLYQDSLNLIASQYAQYRMHQTQMQQMHMMHMMQNAYIPPYRRWEDIKHEGVKLGEVIAFRAWRVRQKRRGLFLRPGSDLIAMAREIAWAPGAVMEGDVDKDDEGVHASKHLGQVIENYASDPQNALPVVYGKVALWGEICEATEGYRAQYGRPVEFLGILPACETDLLEALRKRYFPPEPPRHDSDDAV